MVSACMTAKILTTDRCRHRQTEPLGTPSKREIITRQLWWPGRAGNGDSPRPLASHRSTERNLAPHQHHTLRLAKSPSWFRAPPGTVKRKSVTSRLSKDPSTLSVTRPAPFATTFEGGRKHEPARGLNAARLAIKISAIAWRSTRRFRSAAGGARWASTTHTECAKRTNENDRKPDRQHPLLVQIGDGPGETTPATVPADQPRHTTRRNPAARPSPSWMHPTSVVFAFNTSAIPLSWMHPGPCGVRRSPVAACGT